MGNPYLLVGGLAALATAYFWFTETPIKIRLGKLAPMKAKAVEALAEKWGPIFGAPPWVLVCLAKIESSFDPSEANVTPRAMVRGGAYGLIQQTLETAKGHVAKLRTHYHPHVQEELKKWDGSSAALLDPSFNVMLAARQVGELAARYGKDRLDLIAAGYHGGRGTSDKVRNAGDVAAALGALGKPNGQIYVTRALAAQRSLYG